LDHRRDVLVAVAASGRRIPLLQLTVTTITEKAILCHVVKRITYSPQRQRQRQGGWQ
jgi:hypothetical protein